MADLLDRLKETDFVMDADSLGSDQLLDFGRPDPMPQLPATPAADSPLIDLAGLMTPTERGVSGHELTPTPRATVAAWSAQDSELLLASHRVKSPTASAHLASTDKLTSQWDRAWAVEVAPAADATPTTREAGDASLPGPVGSHSPVGSHRPVGSHNAAGSHGPAGSRGGSNTENPASTAPTDALSQGLWLLERFASDETAAGLAAMAPRGGGGLSAERQGAHDTVFAGLAAEEGIAAQGFGVAADRRYGWAATAAALLVAHGAWRYGVPAETRKERREDRRPG
ncbi:hypothetical protein [Pseudobythopirellula maris]|uniref:hypothetical protein n=1 Tax=Pseudobythopirellula maris TaxID=2527991 RepID=UPI0011B82828|nr:hypothetical protein [Pseudobythopirellula maris]